MNTKKYDFLVIGGGIFGCYSALKLSKRGSVLLVEASPTLMGQASLVNQARVHRGYHYPRARLTATSSAAHYRQFISEHLNAINMNFIHYYGIAKFGSLVNPDQFERFASWIGAPLKAAESKIKVSDDRVEQIFEVEEYSFDASKIREIYEFRLRESGVVVKTHTSVVAGKNIGNEWSVLTKGAENETEIHTGFVVNATYASSNSVVRAFNLSEQPLRYEVSEVVLAFLPEFSGLALTVMDGPFFSVMPFGFTGLHSITSVPYTHHYVSDHPEGSFACQSRHQLCAPYKLASCQACLFVPKSARNRMISQLKYYVPGLSDITVHDSLYTQKVTPRQGIWGDNLQNERPSTASWLSVTPKFLNVLSGKVSGIYELDCFLDD